MHLWRGKNRTSECDCVCDVHMGIDRLAIQGFQQLLGGLLGCHWEGQHLHTRGVQDEEERAGEFTKVPVACRNTDIEGLEAWGGAMEGEAWTLAVGVYLQRASR